MAQGTAMSESDARGQVAPGRAVKRLSSLSPYGRGFLLQAHMAWLELGRFPSNDNVLSLLMLADELDRKGVLLDGSENIEVILSLIASIAPASSPETRGALSLSARETGGASPISIDLRAAEEFDRLVGYARRDAEPGLRKARALATSPTKCCSGRDNSQ